ncbi:uncharacterized protein LOC141588442 [Silene latifolia]|uniref:uncharacterized protein LOC141588442 n=1 Tax=Silene latifolia TaxID=37657 RepID=UPI003D76C6DD
MKKPNLTDDERHRVIRMLFESCKNGKSEHGKMNEVATIFNVTRKSIYSIWTATKKQRMEHIPINRTTLKRLGKAIGHSSSTCHRWVKEGLIKSHTNSIHPALSQDNKFIRLHFVMGKLVFDRLLRCVMFKDMSHIIHIDEKWFYMTNPKCRYYIGSNEALPYRSCKSKRYITKIMFLAAVSRPTYKENGEVLFDGKLGIWPLLIKNQQRGKVRIQVQVL